MPVAEQAGVADVSKISFRRVDMSVATISSAAGVRPNRDRSILRRAYDGMINARARRVKSQVNAHLLGMDDKTLKSLGFSRAELEREGVDATPLF